MNNVTRADYLSFVPLLKVLLQSVNNKTFFCRSLDGVLSLQISCWKLMLKVKEINEEKNEILDCYKFDNGIVTSNTKCTTWGIMTSRVQIIHWIYLFKYAHVTLRNTRYVIHAMLSMRDVKFNTWETMKA